QAAEGVILLGQGAHGEAVEAVDRWHLPLVVWGAATEDGNHVVVGSDNRAGGESVAGHILSLGRKRPCFLGDPAYAENAERLAGFAGALADKGGIEPELIPDVDFTAAAGTEAMRRRLAAGAPFPDALFAANDLLAIGAIQALREHGLRIPADISVVGYDDTALGASMSPALTSVHQDLYQAGVLLARKMLDVIEDKGADSETLPTRLIVRET
ncbi:MAG: substrate-binding domain-containing protein, partial [Wenzhouxiangellaceae bacterium]